MTASEVDTVMSEGLGLRYAFLGPLETAHLNADGIDDYVKRFGEEIFKVSQTYEATPHMQDGQTLQKLAKQCEEMVPKTKLSERRAQRDEFLTKLSELKKKF